MSVSPRNHTTSTIERDPPGHVAFGRAAHDPPSSRCGIRASCANDSPASVSRAERRSWVRDARYVESELPTAFAAASAAAS